MSYAVLARMTGIHLSKLKRIFSGRQEIIQCNYLAIGEVWLVITSHTSP